MKLIFLLISFYIHPGLTDDVVDASKSIVWGPGLKPVEIVMRARYFFIQLCDSSGQNFTKTPKDVEVVAKIKAESRENRACRIWTQTFDSKDGSFIVRYKLYETCYNFQLTLKIQNKEVSSASISTKGPVYEEECFCPESFDLWLSNNECLSSYDQIDEDLKPFPSVDFNDVRNKIVEEFDRPYSVSLCHYVIKNNEIYRKCYGQHVGFKIFSDSVLLSLARKMNLPDVEFFMNLGDWPLISKSRKLYPIFSWCGSVETADIVLPTYDITESSIENMGRVMLDMLSVQSNTRVPWEEKIEKMFWRGRDSCQERLDLIDIARQHPDLFNASITNFFFFKDQMDKYGPGERHISFFDFFKYKYQINIDGTVAAYRLPYLLAGDSLVFKQQSQYYEHFYRHLVPDKHFVPVKRDLSNLVDRLKWFKDHDKEAFEISRAGRALMREVALPQHIFCYYATLLKEWSGRINHEIEVLPDMERVFQPNSTCHCQTKRKENLKEEL